MQAWIGQEIGHYRLLRSLGGGSSSQVYLGEHQITRMKAAVKIRQKPVVHSLLREKREAYVLAQMDHPHILRLREFGMYNDLPFLVTDWAIYGTLRHLFAHDVCIDMAVTTIKHVASALQYMHGQHLIHRDVKPANILLGENGVTFLADFEYAIDYRTCSSNAGTTAYAAPEQKEGYPCPASDQYALGVLVYQWFYGKFPLRDLSTCVEPHLLRTGVSQFPETIEQVLGTALAREPSRRFATVSAFAESLELACQDVWREKLPGRAILPEEAGIVSTDSHSDDDDTYEWTE